MTLRESALWDNAQALTRVTKERLWLRRRYRRMATVYAIMLVMLAAWSLWSWSLGVSVVALVIGAIIAVAWGCLYNETWYSLLSVECDLEEIRRRHEALLNGGAKRLP